MGYIRHHAIVITGGSYEEVEENLSKVHAYAKELFKENQVSPIIGPHINRYYSFFIGPDGSKEGWDDSDVGDENREKLTNYINSLAYEDGSNSIRYAELCYGDDEGYSAIYDSN